MRNRFKSFCSFLKNSPPLVEEDKKEREPGMDIKMICHRNSNTPGRQGQEETEKRMIED
jgi:hypothetical protein